MKYRHATRRERREARCKVRSRAKGMGTARARKLVREHWRDFVAGVKR